MVRPAEDFDRDASAAGEPPYSLDDSVGHLLRRAHQRYAAIFLALGGPGGLTPTQFATLVRLDQSGRITQNRLGRLVALDSATTKGVVQRLRDRGLIAATTDPMDRRTVVLTLTEEGQAALVEARAQGLRARDALLNPLDPGERVALLALLRRLAI
ncbi:MarR family winged helix-turn-helix transcriptional regulator [Humitalea sp. 24SJ18S-53]|uniref:MarR family winged helix-turn-helix transcriptional regulator n=1 Tax=Humitalea sp. 24SJ18S-53 TaxID=3422307 RepID=UPI003D67B44C